MLRRRNISAQTQGLTQKELAARSGLSVEGIRKIERGVSCPQPDTLRLLVEALRLSPASRAAVETAAQRERLQRNHQSQPPPTTARTPTPGNLPTPFSSFVGRTMEIATLQRLLQPHLSQLPVVAQTTPRQQGTPSPTTFVHYRLITLTGMGGCGKTRLALEVAMGLRDQFAHGAWLIELAALRGTRQEQTLRIEQAITTTLELHLPAPTLEGLAPDPAPAPHLSEMLRHRQALLILDTCEHLLTACGMLADSLLRACPHLHILATSREALGISGEYVWAVSPLSLPDPEQSPTVE